MFRTVALSIILILITILRIPELRIKEASRMHEAMRMAKLEKVF